MNRKRVVGSVLLAAVLLAVLALPASAGATRIPFTGQCIFVDGELLPDVRAWFSANDNYHQRGELASLWCEFTEASLTGHYYAEANWDVKFYYDPEFYLLGHDHGPMWMPGDGAEPLWDGIRNMAYTGPGVGSGDVVLHGRGPYAGLIAKAYVTMDFSWEWPVYFEGVILDPGK